MTLKKGRARRAKAKRFRRAMKVFDVIYTSTVANGILFKGLSNP
jgi:hypothetical protein